MLTGRRTEAGDHTGSTGRDRVSVERGNAKVRTRVASAEDIERFYGTKPRATLRALVAEMEGKIVGVIGVSREGDVGKFFSDFSPELEPYVRSITIMRAVKESLNLVRQYRGPVVAIAEHGESCRILNRLGFTHLEGAYYIWLH